ncbi:PREDICTED: zinc finger protein 169-like [Ceratosolen solmsi marchali]|uniref:Zinc finger protein 169-like n=1 Tax=Ceratosolen solmsi marchali TaxID=326594 RepID=A0AAJ7DY63_9HYME|nr:PREDICTED: zinc finger protein 169-like [Ceratosolen solmsi marchali]
MDRSEQESRGIAGREVKYRCPLCGRGYKIKGSLMRHMRIECGKNPMLKCPYCDHCTKYKTSIVKHIRHMHPDKPYCPYITYGNCNIATISTTSKEMNAQRRLRSGVSILKSNWIPRKYFCPDCRRIFDIRASLVRHRMYECEGTNEPAKRENKRKPVTMVRTSRRSNTKISKHQQQHQHQQERHQQQEQQEFQHHHYQTSISTTNSKSKRLYQCSDCDRGYTFLTSLWRHQKYECGVEPRFACSICKTKFSQKGSTRSQLSCRNCGRSYSRRDNLQRHLRFVCGQSPRYVCRTCKRAFKQKSNYQRHVASVHGFKGT